MTLREERAAALKGKTIVVKYGGNAMIHEDLKAAVIEDVVCIAGMGIHAVLVHGGGPEIESMLKKTGKESRFVNGLRYTDEETMEIVQMVLCGKVNKDIVALIQRAGGRALGICGLDRALLRARRIRSEDLGLVGEMEKVDGGVIRGILDSGSIPVLSPVAYGTGDDEGHALNVNADTAAAFIAAAMGAEELVLMTDVQGILRDVRDQDSLIKTVKAGELEGLKKQGIVNKGMIPKTDCCRLALEAGVKKARIIDGRVKHSLLTALFTDESIGTEIEN